MEEDPSKKQSEDWEGESGFPFLSLFPIPTIKEKDLDFLLPDQNSWSKASNSRETDSLLSCHSPLSAFSHSTDLLYSDSRRYNRD